LYSAVKQAHVGAAALVPPTSVHEPPVNSENPLFGSASDDTSGTVRIVPLPAVCQDGLANLTDTPPPPPLHVRSEPYVLPEPRVSVVPPTLVSKTLEPG
jgi:hypothetical protein